MSSPPPKPNSLEAASPTPTSSLPTESKPSPFFITRLIYATLPRSWTALGSVSVPKLSSHSPKRFFSPFYLLTRLYFSSSFSLVWSSALGHQLELDDFEPLPLSRHIATKTAAFTAALTHFSGKDPANKRLSRIPLLRALLTVFKVHILKGIFYHTLYVVIAIGQILLYKLLLEYLIQFYHYSSSSHLPSLGHGVAIVVGSTASLAVAQICRTHALYAMSVAGGEMKTLLAAMLTIKGFVISPLAQRNFSVSKNSASLQLDSDEELHSSDKEDDEEASWTTGTILTLVNTDSERIQLAMRNFNEAWPPLAAIPIVGGLSYWLISWPGLCGLALTLFASLPLFPMIRSLSNLRLRINVATDIRVTKVTDLVTGIRLLKVCAWEDVYADLVCAARHREIKLNQERVQRSSAVFMLAEYMGRAPPLLAVGLHSLISGISISTSPTVLVFIALYYVLGSFCRMAPASMVIVVDGWHSLRRIEAFLLAEESPPRTKRNFETEKAAEESAIELNNAEFSWTRPQDDEQKPHFSLQPLTLSLRSYELLAIVGPTSSGKSSLAAGLAGCMPLIRGHVTHRSLPIYLPATPWLRSGTVRENILFSLPFDAVCYRKVLAACGLEKDVGQFSSGDMTVLGERGITLSGGQRARVGLARGMYVALIGSSKGASTAQMDGGIIIMDDPLSALDPRTGGAVFEDAILRAMSGLTRVLVTHHVQVLGKCDRVVWMENGKIEAVGTFNELTEKSEAFRLFVGEKTQLMATDKGIDEDVQVVSSLHHRGEEIMQEEERGTASVPWSLLASYIHLPSSLWIVILLYLILAVSQVGNVIYGILFAWWTALKYGLGNGSWAAILASVMFTHATFWMLNYIGTQNALITCSEKAANQAMSGVLRAKMSFLDTTPTGRILNRFTQDVNDTDTILPQYVWRLNMSVFCSITSVAFTIYYVPLVAAILVPWLGIAFLLSLLYRPTPLAIKRLEAPHSSDVIAHISELIAGASTIRTSPAAEKELITEMHTKIDTLNRIHFSSFSANAWIGIRADSFSCLLYLAIGLLALRLRYTIIPGVVMTLLMNSLDIIYNVREGLNSLSEVQRGTNCIERLSYYTHNIPFERPNTHNFNPRKSWPERGTIEFKNLSMRYRPNLPLALKDLSLRIEGGEKIGIVGRTGAGKSTIFSVLLGMVDASRGSLLVDGIDIIKIGVNDLRQAMAVIPQEPTLFVGTIRSNLDPRKEKSDEDLLRALQRTGLLDGDGIRKIPLSLDYVLSPGGANLSSGQRQLLSLARAMVRNTRIILVDEATSGVDYETDEKIQAMLMKEFEGRTVVTIAHRIHTIIGYDKIAVIDGGRVAEFGTPRDLWSTKEGIFRGLCDGSGVVDSDFS